MYRLVVWTNFGAPSAKQFDTLEAAGADGDRALRELGCARYTIDEIDDGARRVATVQAPQPPVQRANARLIAAAPDQYAAAVEFDRLSLMIESAVRERCGASSRDHEAVAAAIKANRAAIAKARGTT